MPIAGGESDRKEIDMIWRYILIALSVWLGFGIIALAYGFLAVSFPPVVDREGELRVRPAVSAANEDLLVNARSLFTVESGETGDPFTAGRAAFDIADFTRDPKWARIAARKLGEAREVLPGFAQAIAVQGAAHSFIARDYPVQGAWQILPGPLFVRVYHVRRAESLLDQAVGQAPEDPVVRLLRAAVVSRIPAFVNHENALQDFALLESWEADPSLNPNYAEILRSEDWRGRYLCAHAAALEESNSRKAGELHTRALELYGDCR